MQNLILTLNNGVEMPALGLGVFQSSPSETVEAVKTALRDGYRMIDTAAAYMNEEYVGQGIRESGVSRDEVFVQTKLWLSDYGYDQARYAFDRSMRKLGLEILDLYLLHWPVPTQFDLTLDSWKAVVALLNEERIRAIGVCNSSIDDLHRLIDASGIVPAVNQVELHPYFSQSQLRQAHQDMGIITQAWSPLGGVMRYWDDGKVKADPLQNPVIHSLAAKYDKTPAQIILRWQIELGHSVIPKSVKAERIHENGSIFDFSMTKDEILLINNLDRDLRGGPNPADVCHGMFDLTISD